MQCVLDQWNISTRLFILCWSTRMTSLNIGNSTTAGARIHDQKSEKQNGRYRVGVPLTRTQPKRALYVANAWLVHASLASPRQVVIHESLVSLAWLTWAWMVWLSDACRKRKVRCTGQRPCKRCSQFGIPCNYGNEGASTAGTNVSNAPTYVSSLPCTWPS